MVIGLCCALGTRGGTPHAGCAKGRTLGCLVRVNTVPVLRAHTVRDQQLVQRIRRVGEQ
jgi:hypothetical protein